MAIRRYRATLTSFSKTQWSAFLVFSFHKYLGGPTWALIDAFWPLIRPFWALIRANAQMGASLGHEFRLDLEIGPITIYILSRNMRI